MANQVREAMDRLNRSIEGRRPATRLERAMVEAVESMERPLEPLKVHDDSAEMRLQTAADGLIVRMHIATTEFIDSMQAVFDAKNSGLTVPQTVFDEAERAERELRYVNEMASRHVARLY